MKKYSSYKSSGIEWIGDIPETWDCGKMKYVLYQLSVSVVAEMMNY
jgi:hypothetical protein